MYSIAFIDTEIEPKTSKILDIGGIKNGGKHFHSNAITDFINFLQGTSFICGHNIINHDLMYIRNAVIAAQIETTNVIDTLFLSPLLFPTKPYHALLKDDKLQTEDTNNPLNDAIKAKDLFFDEVSEFNQMDKELKQIFSLLLNDKLEFEAFFRCIGYKSSDTQIEKIIREKFKATICQEADLFKIISENPIELAYCLSLINCNNRYSITPPWVLKNYPKVERIMHLLRSKPCLTGCEYCNQALDIHKGLKDYFGFDAYRNYAGEPLQANAVQAAVDNKSLLAVFPTGGGKSITFQVPALMSGKNIKGLTVVISPLQSLMKDQVDNLERIGITDAVTINGLLDPIERAKSIERIHDGRASILYISPESLRSKTTEKLLLGRKIARFVIDEAHCFSSWGQDFRVDYLYIGDFIKSLQKNKNLDEQIPVSCFTATAKQKVIEDICEYFKEKLGIKFEIFPSRATRTNLQYKVFEKGDDDEKYNTVRDLIEEKECPTIIYVSRTKRASDITKKLNEDGFNARAFYGKMDSKEKTENQNAFITGEVQIMVATSAFGMGVDKKDVGMVIHYEISDSLENYVQEAGRAGRDENITADCYVLFNEEDLSKHFILLNQTKLNLHEIKQIWNAIKFITKFKPSVQKSALEIARAAGWDDNLNEIETRVTTAIAALEEAGYVKRNQNMPKVFANSILSKTAQEAIDKIMASQKFSEEQKVTATRIIKSLISNKSRKQSNFDEAEARVDYISDNLGLDIKNVIAVVNLLRDEKILADAKDLTAFIKKGENKNRSLAITESYRRIENFLCPLFDEQEKSFHIKELNEQAEENGCKEVSPSKIKIILNFWAIKNWIKRYNKDYSKNHIAAISCQPKELLKERIERRHILAAFIVGYMFDKSNKIIDGEGIEKDEVLVEFSVLELQEAYTNQMQLFDVKISIEDIEDTLFYLSRIEAIKIEGGFLVVYNKLTIDRLEQNNSVQYKKQDYEKLSQYYDHKIQQIHIVGEYAKKMIDDYTGALNFVDDYFQLNFPSFINKYFKGSRGTEITRNITPKKYKQLFDSLSDVQRRIIDDKDSRYIVVAAGPGSGKTKVLVHKLASLLLMEDIKHEQLLMVTFSRAATTEFKKRLIDLIGNAAHFIDIKTFHSYCFDLLGKVGTLDRSSSIIKNTVEKIKNNEVEASRITKTVLVIDEAQDMDKEEFELIKVLMEKNEEMRVIAVGDDDQNIYEFRGADSNYLLSFITEKQATKYELITNYRSKSNLVSFTNQYLKTINNRLKIIPIVAHQSDNGKIKMIHYKNGNLITPLINDIISTGLIGTTCILTHKNEDALQVAGLLIKSGHQAKLIQSNDGFSLYNLEEVRFFLNELKLSEDIFIISDDIWGNAKRKLIEKYKYSTKIDICKNLIKDFEAINNKRKYKSDFEVFIRESVLEDFISANGETIFVSTFHKAKGKEFDNVILLLENFDPKTDEKKRQLYVAMTRAKQNLTIHLNGNYLDNLKTEGLETIVNNDTFQPPNKLVLHLSHRDLYLGYFEYVQHRLNGLISGDSIIVCDEGCKNNKGELILKFSKLCLDKISENKQKGFILKEAKINFIVYWTNDEKKIEVKIILPELLFQKN
ncbi:RecQ family ATP-dependent DNA helicase [Flavobacterium sp. SUN046]|uniref:RecQ family ATP-dependent DNA helicase n=1 Tax=Flavobacterium sp. SUN046 TaxID=3002440 RepID=UPI002DBC8031|nr:RecQ family ATP-dependent DNA helicase [Flavobacterium sp. SUN046]MEC4049128.1 RecQ family ATP-dependent DNA helicase [Flavobacterium sp. SUN046]